MNIEILFEDEFYIAVNKPAHLLTHPYKAETNEKENLLFFVRDQIGQYLYPIHRLDRQTSGIVLFGKKPESVREIQEYWGTEKVVKKYKTLIHGDIKQPGEFSFSLLSQKKVPQEALTLYTPLENFEHCTFMEIEIKTGRRHQIRRHFSRRMQHVLGDRKYGKKRFNDFYLNEYLLERLFLHAYFLEFHHPFTDAKIQITSDLPEDLLKVLMGLRKSTL